MYSFSRTSALTSVLPFQCLHPQKYALIVKAHVKLALRSLINAYHALGGYMFTDTYVFRSVPTTITKTVTQWSVNNSRRWISHSRLPS
jgi:hypothetical protein